MAAAAARRQAARAGPLCRRGRPVPQRHKVPTPVVFSERWHRTAVCSLLTISPLSVLLVWQLVMVLRYSTTGCVLASGENTQHMLCHSQSAAAAGRRSGAGRPASGGSAGPGATAGLWCVRRWGLWCERCLCNRELPSAVVLQSQTRCVPGSRVQRRRRQFCLTERAHLALL